MSALPPTFIEGFHDEANVRQMHYNKLGNTDLLVSELSLGGVALGGLYGTFDREDCLRAFDLALRSGVNLIDTAPWYGQGRSELFIRDTLRSVPRGGVYLATKIGRYEPEFSRMFDFSAHRTHSSAHESLERLGVDSVDLLQAHDIEFSPDLATVLEETLPALQELKDAGITRYIGITGPRVRGRVPGVGAGGGGAAQHRADRHRALLLSQQSARRHTRHLPALLPAAWSGGGGRGHYVYGAAGAAGSSHLAPGQRSSEKHR